MLQRFATWLYDSGDSSAKVLVRLALPPLGYVAIIGACMLGYTLFRMGCTAAWDQVSDPVPFTHNLDVELDPVTLSVAAEDSLYTLLDLISTLTKLLAALLQAATG